MIVLHPIFLVLLLPIFILFINYRHIFVIKVHLLVLMFMLFSLSRPVIKEVTQEVSIDSRNIIIAIDISRSMQAKDIYPSRYLFAKKCVKLFLDKNTNDNITLITFTSNPLLLSPPTTDHALISTALDTLNLEYILTKGTSLKRLFNKVAQMQGPYKNLILFTDGGDNEEINSLANIVNQANISLHILALGSEQGTTIKEKDGTLLKDEEGDLVISQINPMLKVLANKTHASYFIASSRVDLSVNQLNQSIRNVATQKIKKTRITYKELYFIPLLFATLLFFLIHTKGIKFLIIFFTLIGVSSNASILDNYYLHQAYTSYNKGLYSLTLDNLTSIEESTLQSKTLLANTYYKQEYFSKAITQYKKITSSNIQYKQQLYFNIANAYVKLNQYTKARIYYAKTLQLGQDIDASFNLKFIALLRDNTDTSLGIAHPKSQDSSSSTQKDAKKDTTNTEDTSNSSSGGEGKKKKEKKALPKKRIESKIQIRQPLSSKVYELINKGYIHEKEPW